MDAEYGDKERQRKTLARTKRQRSQRTEGFRGDLTRGRLTFVLFWVLAQTRAAHATKIDQAK